MSQAAVLLVAWASTLLSLNPHRACYCASTCLNLYPYCNASSHCAEAPDYFT
jgi:hypothetical protein